MRKSAMKIPLAATVAMLFSATTALAGFTDNGDGTVTDRRTNLMWQKCSRGQNNDATCSGSTVVSSWELAIAYCEDLSLGGFTDWRLPNVKELRSIFDGTKEAPPLIDETYFPNTPVVYSPVASLYWSSTTDALFTERAWYVFFGYMGVAAQGKIATSNVRCVRGQ